MTNKQIEELEKKYLNKYYHFLKFAEDEMLSGFKTKEDIKTDWFGLYKSGISDFSTGAERIVYSLLNGKGIGQPNSSPVGADLFFEVEDAYIHIDLKTTGATLNEIKGDKKKGIKGWSNNIGDYTESQPVGINQCSYSSEIKKADGTSFSPKRIYKPNLPNIYNVGTSNEKPCLSYFVTILFDKDTLDTLVISIICMPNGQLESHYKSKVLKAGKNIPKTRFNFSKTTDFEILNDGSKRIKVVYFDKKMDNSYLSRLTMIEDIYDKQ